jgi:SAM-dependent methyltransferase
MADANRDTETQTTSSNRTSVREREALAGGVPNRNAPVENAPAAQPRPLTLASGLARAWRESLHFRGVWGTLREFGGQFFALLSDLTPARRRLRFGDLEFDCDYRVDTTWANVRLATRLREIAAGRPYQPTEPALFRQVVGALGVDCRQFTFIDLGSGKGRALLLASDYPFRRIVGVQLLPELHAIAEQNIGKYASPAQQCREFDLCCSDAREFRFPPQDTVLFLFDPFPEHVLRAVMANLGRSLAETPRRLIVIYQNPVQEEAFRQAAPFLKKVEGTIQYAVFRN